MEDEIQAGDTVTLKSGGTQMTVTNISTYTDIPNAKQATCVWFNHITQQNEKTLIPIVGLKKYIASSIVSGKTKSRNSY